MYKRVPPYWVVDLPARTFAIDKVLVWKRINESRNLSRTRGAQDERRVDIHLTPAGLALRARAVAVPAAIAQAAGCRLDELAGLTTQLQALRRRLLDAANTPPAPIFSTPGATSPALT